MAPDSREGKGTEYVCPHEGDGGNPRKAFVYRDDCKLFAPIPAIEILWNEVRAGYWEARCVSGVEGWHAPNAGRVRRNDPYDPATARHLGQCAFVGETDEAMLRLLLKVTDKGDYDWVQCGSCDAGWQVAHYAAESFG